jgi:hypothetical protein
MPTANELEAEITIAAHDPVRRENRFETLVHELLSRQRGQAASPVGSTHTTRSDVRQPVAVLRSGAAAAVDAARRVTARRKMCRFTSCSNASLQVALHHLGSKQIAYVRVCTGVS